MRGSWLVDDFETVVGSPCARSIIAAGSFEDVASQREEAYIISQRVSSRPRSESTTDKSLHVLL
jgi:hypothetical protein